LFASVTLINGWWVMSIIGMSIILSLIIWRLPLEEKYLEEKFGKEYIEYVEKTPRFFPKIPKFMIQYKKSKS
ncbi:MAG: methyltransferase family protein, partial [Brevinematia bacterium]